MKTCKKCGIEKDSSEFYANPKTKDLLAPSCKSCVKEYQRKFNAEHPENHRKNNVAYVKRLWKTPEGTKQLLKLARTTYWNHPDKARTRLKTRYAIRIGKLSKPSSCTKCGSTDRIHTHHPDYSKPLEVEWLCCKCHMTVHGRKHTENFQNTNSV